ncbi:MAG TPA: isoprenylcysteine carboxylmethyltransferase family protein [Candidatus Deferrimicrobium sp.]|nr:isoprenylcysteine carboxylmethyltransferase family protein [Candidatus Deferrimicrobium sp.]
MESKKEASSEQESPSAKTVHIIHIVSAATIAATSMLDGLLLHISAPITGIIPWYVNLGLFIFFIVLSLPFMIRAYRTLYGGGKSGPDHLITDGIFAQVRNPMYFGIILIYLAVVVLSMSLITLVVWIVIIFIYNWLSNQEEKVLEDIYKDDYPEYKKRTSKWVPR